MVVVCLCGFLVNLPSHPSLVVSSGAEVLDSVQEIGEQCTLDDLACTFFNSVISW